MAEFKKRLTAHKLCISQIFSGEQAADDSSGSFSSFSILLRDKNGQVIQVSKANVIANIVDKYTSSGDRKYSTITLDDATGQIRVKAFSDDTAKLDGLEIGDTVTAIGFLRVYNDEIYMNPEIVRNVDPKWLFVRKLELIKQYGNIEREAAQQAENQNYQTSKKFDTQTQTNLDNQSMQAEIKEEKISNNNPNNSEVLKNKIIEKIKANNEEMDIEQLIMKMDEPIEQINNSINQLLEENILYEPKPGTLKLL